MSENYYHTPIRPLDCHGVPLQPLDLVLINSVPSHYWAEVGTSSLREFEGQYGLITYYGSDSEYEPYYLGNRAHPGWVSGDGSVVNVRSRRVADDSIMTADFWIPPAALQRLKFNLLIMNIFVEYPWQMREPDGPSSTLFIRRGMQEFDRLEQLLRVPYVEMVAAHDAAMAKISKSPSC
jgi:hypothetical protein